MNTFKPNSFYWIIALKQTQISSIELKTQLCFVNVFFFLRMNGKTILFKKKIMNSWCWLAISWCSHELIEHSSHLIRCRHIYTSVWYIICVECKLLLKIVYCSIAWPFENTFRQSIVWLGIRNNNNNNNSSDSNSNKTATKNVKTTHTRTHAYTLELQERTN